MIPQVVTFSTPDITASGFAKMSPPQMLQLGYDGIEGSGEVVGCSDGESLGIGGSGEVVGCSDGESLGLVLGLELGDMVGPVVRIGVVVGAGERLKSGACSTRIS